jgi:glc operon protein GlcG
MKNLLLTQRTLSLEAANKLTELAIKKAIEIGAGGAVAVVDRGGKLLSFQRLDGTIPVAVDITIGKAVTALTFDRPGRVLEATVSEERRAMMATFGVTTMVPLMGSYPVKCNGETIGAIAAGGAGNPHNDEVIVLYALDNFEN